MEENNDTVKDVDLWATNSEDGGWNILQLMRDLKKCWNKKTK